MLMVPRMARTANTGVGALLAGNVVVNTDVWATKPPLQTVVPTVANAGPGALVGTVADVSCTVRPSALELHQ